MPAFLAQMGATVGGILVTMGAQLMTERFLKHLLVQGLESLVARTETKRDDAILQDAKQAWGL